MSLAAWCLVRSIFALSFPRSRHSCFARIQTPPPWTNQACRSHHIVTTRLSFFLFVQECVPVRRLLSLFAGTLEALSGSGVDSPKDPSANKEPQERAGEVGILLEPGGAAPSVWHTALGAAPAPRSSRAAADASSAKVSWRPRIPGLQSLPSPSGRKLRYRGSSGEPLRQVESEQSARRSPGR